MKRLTEEHRRNLARAKTTHGKTGTRIYGVWNAMLARCNNPQVMPYPRYGGRGIKVCDRWLKFENFYADMGDPPPGHTLERVDNDLGYGPGNCRWASRRDQMRNTHRAVRVEILGKMIPLKTISESLGLDYYSMYDKVVRRGNSIDEAIGKVSKGALKVNDFAAFMNAAARKTGTAGDV